MDAQKFRYFITLILLTFILVVIYTFANNSKDSPLDQQSSNANTNQSLIKYSSLVNESGEYWKYMPNGQECTDGQTLVYLKSKGWVCNEVSTDLTEDLASLEEKVDNLKIPTTNNILWSSILNRPTGLDDGDDTSNGASSIDWNDITNRPNGLDDGDNDTVVSQLDWTSITNRPSGLDDGDNDTTANIGSVLPSSTAGSVLFVDSGKAIEENNSLFYWDNVNNRLGIGNSSPNHTLDVTGNIGIGANGYLNFGTTTGTNGYGIRDNSGAVEAKDSGGTWGEVVTEAPSDSNTYARSNEGWVSFNSVQTIVKLGTVTVTNQATLDITTGIDNTYDEYMIKYEITPVDDSRSAAFQISTDGGSNWIASGYRYAGRVTYSDGFSGNITTNSGTSVRLSGETGNASGEFTGGTIKLLNPRSTTLQKFFQVDATELTYHPHLADQYLSGSNSTLSAVNAVRILFNVPSASNIAVGKATLYGITR